MSGFQTDSEARRHRKTIGSGENRTQAQRIQELKSDAAARDQRLREFGDRLRKCKKARIADKERIAQLELVREERKANDEIIRAKAQKFQELVVWMTDKIAAKWSEFDEKLSVQRAKAANVQLWISEMRGEQRKLKADVVNAIAKTEDLERKRFALGKLNDAKIATEKQLRREIGKLRSQISRFDKSANDLAVRTRELDQVRWEFAKVSKELTNVVEAKGGKRD
jgi:chromosome segregation ATPase